MSFRLLIDECLSPELVQMAVDAGYGESTCVRDRGRLGVPDWELMVFVVNGDFTLVTQNARDFRGVGPEEPGGLHASEPIHAGLICLNSVQSLDIDRQRRLFKYALAELVTLPDLVNQALEIFEDENGEVTSVVYELPAQL
jgi:predicted nuclease of predicted toxin-antitoxin system